MNILVLTPVSIPDLGRCIPDWGQYRGEYWFYRPPLDDLSDAKRQVNKPTAIVSMSVSAMDQTFEMLERFPDVPLFCYMWDCYEWVWTSPRPGEYDYRRYGELLKLARKVWVPSACTARRVRQWWGLDSEVILSSVPWFDHPDVRDGGYALCTLRHIPDTWDTKFEEACEELHIPYVRTDHRLSRREYEDAVARCRFMVSHYHEASTGGLSLLEGYRLGKPVLINNSEWNGANEYFGCRAKHFTSSSGPNFKFMLLWMRDTYTHHLYPRVGPDHKEWVEENFSDRRMIDDMMRSVEGCL